VVARGALREVALTWAPVQEEDVVGYDIWRADDGQDLVPVATQIQGGVYRDKGLDPLITYRYAVRAVDLTNNISDFSEIILVQADGLGLPAVPQPIGIQGDLLQPILVAQNGGGSIPLQYQFELALDETFVQLVDQTESAIGQSDRTTWPVSIRLESGQTYFWRVRAFDGVFYSAYSEIQRFVAGSRSGDFDSDNAVGFSDFIIFVTGYGKHIQDVGYQSELDLDSNQRIDFSDFIQFARLFGTTY